MGCELYDKNLVDEVEKRIKSCVSIGWKLVFNILQDFYMTSYALWY